MLLIIEGMRGSGKTTLCQQLLDDCLKAGLKAEKFKGERSDTESPFDGMLKAIKQFDLNPDTVFILDRFHLTEYVMSTYLQRVETITLLTQIKTLDAYLSARSAKCVILDASYDTIDNRMSLRDERRKLDMPVLNAKNLWLEAKALSRIATIRPNDTIFQQQQTIEALISYAELAMRELKREM